MFITEEDYRVVIGENALKVVSQASQEIRDNAESRLARRLPATSVRNTTRKRYSRLKAKTATVWW